MNGARAAGSVLICSLLVLMLVLCAIGYFNCFRANGHQRVDTLSVGPTKGETGLSAESVVPPNVAVNEKQQSPISYILFPLFGQCVAQITHERLIRSWFERGFAAFINKGIIAWQKSLKRDRLNHRIKFAGNTIRRGSRVALDEVNKYVSVGCCRFFSPLGSLEKDFCSLTSFVNLSGNCGTFPFSADGDFGSIGLAHRSIGLGLRRGNQILFCSVSVLADAAESLAALAESLTA